MWVFYGLLISLKFISFASCKKQNSFVKEDLNYIGCDVCEKTVSELFNAVAELRSSRTKPAVNELEIIELIETIYNPESTTGAWIKKIDIVEISDKGKTFLSFEEPGGISKCGNECLTIAKSSESLLQDEVDIDVISSMLWKNRINEEDAKTKVCKEWTSRCKPRRKALAARYKRSDYPFEAKSEKELEMEKLMASMKGMGMGANMYSRDDMAEMMESDGMGTSIEDYEDEEQINENSSEVEDQF